MCAYVVATVFAVCNQAHASLTVLVGEPFGPFGTMMPVGHAAIYLDHVCAAGPLKLRMCQPGEPEGVVIARYHQIGNLDWIATPVMQFLYATDSPQNIPSYVTPEIAWDMRQTYRRRYLADIVPDGKEKAKVTDEWWESAGVAFNRKLWGYQLATTREQDEAFVDAMNDRINVHRYHLSTANCANFAGDVVNAYFPGAVHHDIIADYGWLTPKQVARSIAAYGNAHPELNPRILEIPQIPGTLRRSRPVRGAGEALLKTKRYLATLIVIQPEIPLISTILYLDRGRWQIGQGAEPVGPDVFAPRTSVAGSAADPALTASPTTGSETMDQQMNQEN
ncbi:DUF4105 domain-containing protein [Granulicella tundricola]|nr:DUF4105 domain-containing protein [Granulicella tundricola]